MPRRHADWRRTVVLSALVVLAGCGAPSDALPEQSAPATEIGLLTSLPLFWPETDGPADMLSPDGAIPWPRALIEQRHVLVPLDTLDGAQGLARVSVAVLAQPRPLSAGENVALDDWVRAGGHVLVFADPALTEDSRFGFGDRRRPMDTAMLSPILARWGLELAFDEDAPAGEAQLDDAVAGALPVNLPGQLAVSANRGESAGECRVETDAVVARCRIGRGSATIVADAALFETAAGPAAALRKRALAALIDSLAASAAGTTRVDRGTGGEGALAPVNRGLTGPLDHS